LWRERARANWRMPVASRLKVSSTAPRPRIGLVSRAKRRLLCNNPARLASSRLVRKIWRACSWRMRWARNSCSVKNREDLAQSQILAAFDNQLLPLWPFPSKESTKTMGYQAAIGISCQTDGGVTGFNDRPLLAGDGVVVALPST